MKAKLKKEALETEIDLLENHIKLKKQELRHSCTSLNEDHDINQTSNPNHQRLSLSVDNRGNKCQKICCGNINTNKIKNEDITGYSVNNQEVIEI